MIRTAIIGLGSMGKYTANLLNEHPEYTIIATCDLKDINSKLPNHYLDYKEMLAKESLDIIFICTPPNSRTSIIMSCIEKNISFFSEKPICSNAHELNKIHSILSKKKDLLFFLGVSERYNQALKDIKAIFNSNQLGNLKLIESHGSVPRTKPSNSWLFDSLRGGGATFESLIHYIDIIYWITKQSFDPLFSIQQVRKSADTMYDETVIGQCVSEKNILFQFRMSFINFTSELESSITFYFDDGKLEYKLQNQPVSYSGTNSIIYQNKRLHPYSIVDLVRKSSIGSHNEQLNQIATAIRKSKPIFSCDDLLIPMQTVFKINENSKRYNLP